MNIAPDVIKKTAIVLVMLVVVGLGGYFIKKTTTDMPEGPRVSILEKVQQKRVVRNIVLSDVAPPQKRYGGDRDAINAMISCKRANLSLVDCVKRQNKNYEVTAAVPGEVMSDGFEGFIMFPISGNSQIIMDYNRRLDRQQMIFYGSFSDLQDQVREGGMNPALSTRVQSVRDIVN